MFKPADEEQHCGLSSCYSASDYVTTMSFISRSHLPASRSRRKRAINTTLTERFVNKHRESEDVYVRIEKYAEGRHRRFGPTSAGRSAKAIWPGAIQISLPSRPWLFLSQIVAIVCLVFEITKTRLVRQE